MTDRNEQYAPSNQLEQTARHFLFFGSYLRHIGLFDGKMGLMIFLFHYARHSGNSLYEDFAMELFGNKDYEKIVGIFASASTAGFAIGSPFGNFCYDLIGNYNIAFYVFGAMLIFVTVSMQYALTAANHDRKVIEEAEKIKDC